MTPIENNLDNISFKGAYIIEEIDKKNEELQKAKEVLKTSDASVTTIKPHKINWHQVDRWNKTPLNYLEEALKTIEIEIISNSNDKDCENLINDKNKLEKVMNDIFMHSFVSIE